MHNGLVNDFSRGRIDASVRELGEERGAVADLGSHGLEDDLRAREGHAAHQVGPLRDGTSARGHGALTAALIVAAAFGMP